AGYPFPLFSLFLPSPSSPAVERLPSGVRAWWRPEARAERRSGVRGARRRWPTDVKGPSWVRSSPGIEDPMVYLPADVAVMRRAVTSVEASPRTPILGSLLREYSRLRVCSSWQPLLWASLVWPGADQCFLWFSLQCPLDSVIPFRVPVHGGTNVVLTWLFRGLGKCAERCFRFVPDSVGFCGSRGSSLFSEFLLLWPVRDWCAASLHDSCACCKLQLSLCHVRGECGRSACSCHSVAVGAGLAGSGLPCVEDACRQVQMRCSWSSSAHLGVCVPLRLREPACCVAFTSTELCSALLVLVVVRFPQSCVVRVSGCYCVALEAEDCSALVSAVAVPPQGLRCAASVGLAGAFWRVFLEWCLGGSGGGSPRTGLHSSQDRPLSLLVEVLPRSALCLFRATVVLPLWFEVFRLVELRPGESAWALSVKVSCPWLCVWLLHWPACLVSRFQVFSAAPVDSVCPWGAGGLLHFRCLACSRKWWSAACSLRAVVSVWHHGSVDLFVSFVVVMVSYYLPGQLGHWIPVGLERALFRCALDGASACALEAVRVTVLVFGPSIGRDRGGAFLLLYARELLRFSLPKWQSRCSVSCVLLGADVGVVLLMAGAGVACGALSDFQFFACGFRQASGGESFLLARVVVSAAGVPDATAILVAASLCVAFLSRPGCPLRSCSARSTGHVNVLSCCTDQSSDACQGGRCRPATPSPLFPLSPFPLFSGGGEAPLRRSGVVEACGSCGAAERRAWSKEEVANRREGTLVGLFFVKGRDCLNSSQSGWIGSSS
ncbi:hypothetical protein Taro_032493, partial [Colocasia esculenta]|nr:hypothetical protein [Colocasia esculenta]